MKNLLLLCKSCHFCEIPQNFTFQILFTGTRGNSYRGDIALDNIVLMDGACSEYTVLIPLCHWQRHLFEATAAMQVLVFISLVVHRQYCYADTALNTNLTLPNLSKLLQEQCGKHENIRQKDKRTLFEWLRQVENNGIHQCMIIPILVLTDCIM